MRAPLCSPGLWGSVVLAGAGLWLLVAPRAVGFQAAGTPWTAGTCDDVVVGAVLVVASVTGAFAHAVLALRDAAAAARSAVRGHGADGGAGVGGGGTAGGGAGGGTAGGGVDTPALAAGRAADAGGT